MLFQALVTGFAQGAMIALVALGYTMVFGVLKMINFAHSEVFMIAAYAGLFVMVGIAGRSSPVVVAVAGNPISGLRILGGERGRGLLRQACSRCA
ncbi:MAG: hypothetical protein WCI05_15165, partial [Myxococcales bacterium]